MHFPSSGNPRLERMTRPGTFGGNGNTTRTFTRYQSAASLLHVRPDTAVTSRPRTTMRNFPKIGFSPTRARISTAQPKYKVKPVKSSRTPTESSTSSSFVLFPAIPSKSERAIEKKAHVEAMESETIEKLDYEFQGLNDDQTDSMLQTLYQTQVVRDKYTSLLQKTDYFEDEDEEVLGILRSCELNIRSLNRVHGSARFSC